MGYNFLSDVNSLDPVPTGLQIIDTVQLQNGIYDEMYVTSDTSASPSTTFPEYWDSNTIMYPQFNGTVNAGADLGDISVSDITAVRIKRRVQGDTQWITLQEIPINSSADLTFAYNDILNESLTTYEYAMVLMNQGVEGEYIINSIDSVFDGVFVSDEESIYKLYYSVAYSSNQRVQKIGTFEPFGQQYPIYVSNGMVNYEKGSVTGQILPNDYASTGTIDRKQIVQLKNQILKFLTNKQPKVIKDWNGNSWLVMIVDNPTVSFNQNFGMGMASVSFNFSEVGDVHNQQDLYNTGFANVLE